MKQSNILMLVVIAFSLCVIFTCVRKDEIWLRIFGENSFGLDKTTGYKAETHERTLYRKFNKTPNELVSWDPPKLPDHLQDVDQTDPELIAHIRDHWIIPPFQGPIKLKDPKIPEPGRDRSEQKQPTIIDKLFKQSNEGFYVECGAADGEFNSNSLLFELYRNWDGILIEANPVYFAEILKKKRRAFMLNACLSPARTPKKLNFTVDGIGGGIADLIPPTQRLKLKSDTKLHLMVQCFPLYSILQALGINHVNYFSLDIEGPELNVLKTMRLNDTIIDVISIETRIVDDVSATKVKVKECLSWLEPFGYHLVAQLRLDIVVSRLEQ